MRRPDDLERLHGPHYWHDPGRPARVTRRGLAWAGVLAMLGAALVLL